MFILLKRTCELCNFSRLRIRCEDVVEPENEDGIQFWKREFEKDRKLETAKTCGQRRNRRGQLLEQMSEIRGYKDRSQLLGLQRRAAQERTAAKQEGILSDLQLLCRLKFLLLAPRCTRVCFLSHKLFLESSCSVVLTCFTTASIKASFLGVHPSECPKYAAKTCIPPLTLTTLERCSLHSQGWTKQLRCLCRPLLPDCCRLRQRLTLDVCLRSSLPSFSTVILTASAAKSPSLLGQFVELLLHLFFPHPVARFRSRCQKYLCTFSCTSSLCTTRIHSTRYTSLFFFFFAFHSFHVAETFFSLLCRLNCSSPLLSPVGSPPTFVPYSERYPRPHQPFQIPHNHLDEEQPFLPFSPHSILFSFYFLSHFVLSFPFVSSASFSLCCFALSLHHFHEIHPVYPRFLLLFFWFLLPCFFSLSPLFPVLLLFCACFPQSLPPSFFLFPSLRLLVRRCLPLHLLSFFITQLTYTDFLLKRYLGPLPGCFSERSRVLSLAVSISFGFLPEHHAAHSRHPFSSW